MKVLFTFLFFIFFVSANGSIYTVTDAGTIGGMQFQNFVGAANSSPARDTINFNISGTGPHILNVGTNSSVAVTAPLFIDGFSQPGNDSSAMSVRISTTYGLNLSSENITVQGIYFLASGIAPRTAIRTSSMQPDTLRNINFVNNTFKEFDFAINLEAYHFSDTIVISDINVYGNTFLSNTYSFNVSQMSGVNIFKNFVLLFNYFNNTAISITLTPQILPNNIVFSNNTQYYSGFGIRGEVNQLRLDHNNIESHSSINISNGNINNVSIINNHFKANNNGMVLMCDGQKLIIQNNKFDASNSLPIQIFPDQNLQLVRVENNNFTDIRGLNLNVGAATGSVILRNVIIQSNSFTQSVVSSNVNSYLSFNVGGTSAFCHLDSVAIINNVLRGGAISFECSSTIAHDSLTRIYVDSNTVKGNNNINPGIEIRMGSNSFSKDLNITNNEVDSFSTGILVRTVVAFGYEANIRNGIVMKNKIFNCGDGIVVGNGVNVNVDSYVQDISISENNIFENAGDGIGLFVNAEHAGYINKFQFVAVNNNTLHDNVGYGIHFLDAGADQISVSPVFDHISFSQNSIYNNGLKGIWIENVLDFTGPSTPFYPVPVITNIDFTTNTLYGTIQADTLTSYRIEVFGNNQCDSSGWGEGEYYEGDVMTTTDNFGVGFFQMILNSISYSDYSLTSTSLSDGNTSVFSRCVDTTVNIINPGLEKLRIYPNPTSRYCYLSGFNEKPRRIFLYSSAGTVFDITNKYFDKRIDLSDFPGGIYELVIDQRRVRVVKN